MWSLDGEFDIWFDVVYEAFYHFAFSRCLLPCDGYLAGQTWFVVLSTLLEILHVYSFIVKR